jgi:heme-NO-binding protein
MHGIILTELKKYVDSRVDTLGWNEILRQARVEPKLYMPVGVYDDAEAVAIVAAAAQAVGIGVGELLEDFGEFIAPHLIELYKPLIRKEWRTLDLLLNTESNIHQVVRLRNPGAQPPQLRFVQTGPNELLFVYDSPRRMSSLAKGIIRGVAKYYGEAVRIDETHFPQGSCEMLIRVVPSGKS